MRERVDDRSTERSRGGSKELPLGLELRWKVRNLTKDSRCHRTFILQSMGCVKSKKSDPTGQNANSTEKMDGKVKGSKGEKAYLVQSEVGPPDNSPQVNPVLLEYAQKLSEEIVVRAVQQWVEVDRRYSDIPYIECDVPWHGDEGVAAESPRAETALTLTLLHVIKQGWKSQTPSLRILPASTCCEREYEWAVSNSVLTYFWIGLYLDWA